MKVMTGMSAHKMISGLLVSLLALQFACADDAWAPEESEATSERALTPTVADEQLEALSQPVFWVDIPDNATARTLFDGDAAQIESPDAFQQVSWMMDAEDASELRFRVRGESGDWSKWSPVEITWNEGDFYNALIRLDTPATELELRGGEKIQLAQLEFYDEVVARDHFIETPRADEVTGAEAHQTDEVGTVQAAIAPSSTVTSRAQWGAVNPDKVCGNVVAPHRMAIHHTAIPADDGGDAAARMRQMQNFHLNDRGWCDIGYHFVVAQSGEIFQGRSRSDRPGAHVGGQNSGNVGIALIGDFSTQSPSNTQLDSAAEIMKWVHDTHHVSLDRGSVKGHREHAGQSTNCPGGNLLNQLDDLINRAAGSTPPSSGTGGNEPAPAPSPDPDSGSNDGSGGSTNSPSDNTQNLDVEQGCNMAGGSPLGSPILPLILVVMGLMLVRTRDEQSAISVSQQ